MQNNTLISLLSKDPHERFYSQLKCNLKHEFWKDYHHNKNFILDNCKRLLPHDIESLHNQGPLERYMLKFLIYNDPEFNNIKETYKDVIFESYPLYFAFGFIQNDRNEVIKISQAIQRFHRSKKPFMLTLFLGIVTHWVTLVVYKYDPSQPPLMIFLNSSLTNVLDLDEITLSSEVDEKVEQGRKFTGKEPILPFYLKYFKHFIYDARMLLKNLEDIIINKTEQFHTFAFRRITHNVLKSFESTLAFIIDSENRFLINYNHLDRKISQDTDKNLSGMSISDEFRHKLYALDDTEYKEQLKEFFFPISDAVGDYTNILELERDSNEVVTVIENLQFWMYEYHPTHVYKCIYSPMVHYGQT